MTTTKKTDDDVTDAPEPVPAEAPIEVVTESVSYAQAIRLEYSQYRAVQVVHVDGVPAFNAGAAVPASHPLLAGWLADGMVVPVDA